MRVEEKEWKWFGGVGHLCVGRWCRFHLCTQVGGYLVSTVGEYVPPRNSGGSERAEMEWLMDHPLGHPIGCDRYFETMVFVAGKPCNEPDCYCEIPEIDVDSLDFIGYKDRKSARDGHLQLCRKYAEIIPEPATEPLNHNDSNKTA